jgi:NF-X1-type zinc finger protein NFXL1
VLEVPSNQPKADTISSLSRENTLAEPCERCDLRCQMVSSLFPFAIPSAGCSV